MVRITKIEHQNKAQPKKKKVAAYCRVSTDSAEQMDSLEVQRSHYEQLIKGNPNWQIAGVFFDEGITGTSIDKRFGFQNMLEDCKAGLIDLVLTKSISRFARNAEDTLRTIRTLQRYNVGVFFEKENINTLEMEGETLLAILASMAQDESANISKNIKWAIQTRFQEGTYVISTPPFGYKNVDRKLVIDEKTAPIVRRIFDMFLSGSGCDKIAMILTQEGVPSPKSNKWHSATIYGILKNEAYVGDLRFQKTYKDPEFKSHKNKGELPQFLVKNHHEPIVSRGEFSNVSEMMKTNRKFKSIESDSDKYLVRYPFSGKLVCGVCGHTFKRKVIKSTYETRIAWACNGHLKDLNTCDSDYVQNESIENAFMTMRNKLICFADEIFKPIIESEKSKTLTSRKPELDAALEENIFSRQRIRALLGKGYLEPAAFADENARLLEEFRNLAEQKAQEEEKRKRSSDTEILVTDLYKTLKGLQVSQTFDDAFFSDFVDKVIISKNHTALFKLKCGLEFTEVF